MTKRLLRKKKNAFSNQQDTCTLNHKYNEKQTGFVIQDRFLNARNFSNKQMS